MSKSITNYDGGIVTTPQQVVRPTTVETLQEIMRDTVKYPGPVRAMGSYHSLTPCASSTGTIVDMDGLNRVLRIDAEAMTITAQAGVQLVDAAAALRKLNLQFMLNIEIGNITLGSAACCHTKDSLDGVELGQVNSYLVAVKWVSPSGSLEEASARQESRTAAIHSRELRPGGYRLRSHVPAEAARSGAGSITTSTTWTSLRRNWSNRRWPPTRRWSAGP